MSSGAKMNDVNIYRDGEYLVVPVENAVFPNRCVKTNREIDGREFRLTLDCASKSLINSDLKAVAGVAGVLTGGTSRLGMGALATAEFIATRRRVKLQVGLNDKYSNRFRKVKRYAWRLMAAGILVPTVMILLLGYFAPDWSFRNRIVIPIVGGTGFATFWIGVGLYIYYGMAILKPASLRENYAWLSGAGPDFLASLEQLPVDVPRP